MKKVLFIATLCLSALTVYAQKPKGTFTFYPRIGMNLSKFRGDGIYASTLDKEYKARFKTGFVGGAEVQYQFGDNFALSAGALYSRQGTKYEEMPLAAGDEKQPVFVNEAIIVPLMLVGTTRFGLSAKVGIQPEININNRLHYYDSWADRTDRIGFSIPVGLGYEYRNLNVDVRYNIGLTNVGKNFFSNDKNRTVSITLGYGIEL